MQKKVSVAIAQFAYAGNGGNSSLIPEMAFWLAKAYHRLKTDHRVERVGMEIYSDTPIYMTRNRAIKDAREAGFDFLLMLDSDNEPDAYYGREPVAQAFLNEPFDFVYQRYCQGLPTFLAAPYCGPPPHPLPKLGVTDYGEVPYLFQWTNTESDVEQWKISMLTREHAAILRGIVPMACLPTGVCLSTLSVWDGPPKPHFDYEHDPDKTEKRSTEDCFATRNLSLYWHTKGIETCFAACDSWALHHKPKRVGRPKMPVVEQIAKEMRDVILNDRSGAVELRQVDYTANMKPPLQAGQVSFFPKEDMTPHAPLQGLPRRGQMLRHDQNEVLITDEELEEARILLERKNGVIDRAVINSTPPVAEAALWLDEQVIDPDYGVVTVANDEAHKGNGHPLVHRMICGRKVASLPSEVPEKSLEAIQALTAWAARSGPIEVAVAHAGCGQASAAMLAELPEGSHLYALDSVMTYQFSAEPAMQFAQSFQPELEAGRVMADLGGRKFPWPSDQQHLDMVFIERSLTVEKCQKWLSHVVNGGVLAGLGYEANAKHIDQLAANHGLKKKTIGDVWALVK